MLPALLLPRHRAVDIGMTRVPVTGRPRDVTLQLSNTTSPALKRRVGVDSTVVDYSVAVEDSHSP